MVLQKKQKLGFYWIQLNLGHNSVGVFSSSIKKPSFSIFRNQRKKWQKKAELFPAIFENSKIERIEWLIQKVGFCARLDPVPKLAPDVISSLSRTDESSLFAL